MAMITSRMKQLYFVTTVFVTLFANDVRADPIDDLIKKEMQSRQIPGLALTIIRDSKPTKTAAYGLANIELKVSTTTETTFEIGSVTKQFTAAGILLLQQQGKLSVDHAISQFLPDLPPAWTNITIRQLLSHSSGIKSYTGLDGFELTRHLTQKQFVAALAPLPLEFKPGDRWKYCNSGYNLLGYIIENVSGKNYWTFMAENIFSPLGMVHVTNREPSILIANRADGYEKKNGRLINRDYDLTDVFAAGAMVSTVGDLAKWNAALDSDNLLNAKSKSQMWASGKLNDGTEPDYGFGWHLASYKGHKNIGHSGSTSGFSASLQRFPENKLCVILLCNSGDDGVATTLAKIIATTFWENADK